MNIKVRKWRVLGGFLLVLLVLGGVAIVHAGDNENPMEEGRLAEHALEVAGETLQQLKMEVKHDFGAGNAYGGALRIIGGIPLIPNDAQYARDVLELGQMFKFAYDNLLTVAQDREILEKHLVKADNPRMLTLWLLCFPSYDALNPEQLEAAFTTYGQILESEDILARMACYGISVSVYREMGFDSMMVQSINELGKLDKWQTLTQEVLFSAISGLNKEPERMVAFLDNPEWSLENKKLVNESVFSRLMRNAAPFVRNSDEDKWISVLAAGLNSHSTELDKYYIVSMIGKKLPLSSAKDVLTDAARQDSDGVDAVRAQTMILSSAMSQEDIAVVEEMANTLSRISHFPFISDRKIEAEVLDGLRRAAVFLEAHGKPDVAKVCMDRIVKRYPESALAAKITGIPNH